MPRKKKVKSSVGKNLSSVLSRTLVKDWYAAVSELVCNSYDADAEEVHIELGSQLETLIVKDDGEGMDEKGLGNFFRLGDSSKIIEPVSPKKKRKRIGKFGIAKVLLQYLSYSFKIESVKNGFLYCVDEGVVEESIQGQKYKVSKDMPNGTSISLRDLRFKIGKEKGEFDIRKLQERLKWDIPNKPDFNVFMNGQLIKKRGVVEYARVYRVKERIGNHLLTGRIYWRKKDKRDLEGIRIYVNGRAVGEPSMFNLGQISFLLEGRTQGEIHADFLEDIVTLDRTDFQEDPRLDKVKEAIIRVLTCIKEDTVEGRGRRDFYKDQRLYEQVQTALGLAEEQLNQRIKNVNYILLELSSQEKSGPLSFFNKESKTIYLNAGNKMFTFLSRDSGLLNRKNSEIYMKRAFLIAAAHALTRNGEKNQELDRLIEKQTAILFRDFLGIASAVNRFIGNRVLTPLSELYFNKYRLYDSQELSNLTGRPAVIIRLLHTSGALKGTEEHLFDKTSIFKTFRHLEGYISCVEVVDKGYQTKNIMEEGLRVWYDKPKPTSLDVGLTYPVVREYIKKLGIVDVGKKHPLHFVPTTKADEFREYVKRKGVYNGK